MKEEIIEKNIEKIFINRMKGSNVFKEKEIDKIQKDIILYEKSYLLGIFDGK